MTKKNKLMKSAKDTMKVGMMTMGGSFALGKMGALPGMPAAANTSLKTANAGLNLVNVGQLVKTSKDVFSLNKKHKCKHHRR